MDSHASLLFAQMPVPLLYDIETETVMSSDTRAIIHYLNKSFNHVAKVQR